MSSMGKPRLVNVQEYADFAARTLDKNALDYYASGANDEQTLSENKEAFKRLRIRPRILRNVAKVDMRTSLMGKPLAFPVALSPSAMQKMAHKDGEQGSIRAAGKVGSAMILSSLSTTSLEDVAKASPSTLRWFQLYVYKDRQLTQSLVARAEKAGYSAIVVTVDTPYLGRREADVRNKFKLPDHLRLGNFQELTKASDGIKTANTQSGLAEYVASLFDPSLNWKDIAWLKSITKLPVVVKGVMTAEDAKEAVSSGVDAIMVSNHGARQLDGVAATIEVLGEVVSAVNSKVEVYLDGGIRRGTDVFKALALGATAVFIGRPVLWGLTYDGEKGVQGVLELLKEEFQLCMALAGCRSVKEITRNHIRPAFQYLSKL